MLFWTQAILTLSPGEIQSPGTAPEDGSCYCVTSVPRDRPDVWLGRPARGTVIRTVTSLSRRVIALAKDIGLPPIAIPSVLAAAYQDLIDGASLGYTDDWETLDTFGETLSQVRFEEYVFALIATRELTPVQRLP